MATRKTEEYTIQIAKNKPNRYLDTVRISIIDENSGEMVFEGHSKLQAVTERMASELKFYREFVSKGGIV